MKNAAKCDTSCELQNPVNHQNFERTLRFRDIPGSMPVGVSAHTPLTPLGRSIKRLACCAVESERRFTLHVKVKRPSKSRPAHMERAFQTSGPVVSSSDRFALFTAGVVSSHEHHRQRVGRSLIRETEYTLMVVRRSLPRQDLEGLET